ncbi:hypothetical protein K2Z84_27945 [Candidatus Binatia bacterium]|nr:hypothetical protein [Candidatus Binatia bacterium]
MLVDERRACFDEHNHFFAALLGMESLGAKLDALIRDHGTARVPVELASEDVVHDPFLCAVLGLIAFRARLAALLESARCASVAPREAAPLESGRRASTDLPPAETPHGRHTILR